MGNPVRQACLLLTLGIVLVAQCASMSYDSQSLRGDPEDRDMSSRDARYATNFWRLLDEEYNDGYDRYLPVNPRTFAIEEVARKNAESRAKGAIQRGPTGPRGKPGVQGPRGLRGQKGDAGPQGPSGTSSNNCGFLSRQNAAGTTVVFAFIVESASTAELAGDQCTVQAAARSASGQITADVTQLINAGYSAASITATDANGSVLTEANGFFTTSNGPIRLVLPAPTTAAELGAIIVFN